MTRVARCRLLGRGGAIAVLTGVILVGTAVPAGASVTPENANTSNPVFTLSGCNGSSVHNFVAQVKATGALAVDSGPTKSCSFQPQSGSLVSGGSYAASVRESGSVSLTSSPKYVLGNAGQVTQANGPSQVYLQAQKFLEESSVNVAPELGVSDLHGLRMRFWPTTTSTANDADSVKARGGSQTADAATTTDFSKVEQGYQKVGCNDADPKTKQPAHCNNYDPVLSTVDYTATDTGDPTASANAAAYDIAGTNVSPSFTSVMTSDNSVAVDHGVSFSTDGDHLVSVAFGLRQNFAFKGLAYIKVPTTGVYRFGAASPGGAKVVLYQPSDTNLGETTVLDAWAPRANTTCAGSITLDKQNKVVSQKVEEGYGSTTTYYTYEHPSSDESWWWPNEDEQKTLADNFRYDCRPGSSATQWGTTVQLTAGVQYPIEVDGWFGFAPGEFSLSVQTPDGTARTIPYDWLNATTANVTSFSRDANPVSTTGVRSWALALDGYGNELAVGSSDSTELYHTTGNGTWEAQGALQEEGQSLGFSTTVRPYPSAKSVAFDDQGDTLAVGPTKVGTTAAKGNVYLFTRKSDGLLTTDNSTVESLSKVVTSAGQSWIGNTVNSDPSLVSVSANGLVAAVASPTSCTISYPKPPVETFAPTDEPPANGTNSVQVRVSVVSRASRNDPWHLSSYETAKNSWTVPPNTAEQNCGSLSVAAGDSNETGYAAYSLGPNVQVLRGTNGASWTAKTTINAPSVSDLSLDYGAQHLAVAQAGKGSVLIYARNNDNWSQQHVLSYGGGVGSMTVNYSYRLLTVGWAANPVPMLYMYRDLAGDWSSYGAWSRLVLSGDVSGGSNVVMGSGAESPDIPTVVGASVSWGIYPNAAPALATFVG